MFISLSILLILLFALGFWIVRESNASLSLKLLTITLFLSFCVLVGTVLDSALGWSTGDKGLPNIVTIRYVVIKEPNKQYNFEGCIYMLLDMPPTKYDSFLLSLFGHKTEHVEPRLFKLPYSRPLHENLQNNVIPRLMKGQSVTGKLSKGKPGKGGKGGKGTGDGDGDGEGEGENGKNGKGKGGRGQSTSKREGNGKGDGDESLNPGEYIFYELPPSYFLQKHQ